MILIEHILNINPIRNLINIINIVTCKIIKI